MKEAFFPRPPAQLVGFSTPRHRSVLLRVTARALADIQTSESSVFLRGCPQNMSNWTSLWYIWLILLTLFLLLLCGIAASCIRFCCQKKRLPVETFSRHPYDLTVIAIDSDSTAHSTVTSYSSWQYPLNAPIPSVFVDMDKNTVSLPAYSLYTMELPPSYDEAVQTGKQHIEVPRISQKCNDIPGQVTSGGMNPIQYSPGTSNRYPATQANSGNSEDATQEQLQLCHSFQMGSKGREGE